MSGDRITFTEMMAQAPLARVALVQSDVYRKIWMISIYLPMDTLPTYTKFLTVPDFFFYDKKSMKPSRDRADRCVLPPVQGCRYPALNLQVSFLLSPHMSSS